MLQNSMDSFTCVIIPVEAGRKEGPGVERLETMPPAWQAGDWRPCLRLGKLGRGDHASGLASWGGETGY